MRTSRILSNRLRIGIHRLLAGMLLAATWGPAPARETKSSNPGASSGWLSQVTEDIQRSEYRFHLTENGAWSAPNRAHDLRSDIAEEGIVLTSRTGGAAAWKLGLCVRAFGREGSVKEVEAPVAYSDGNRIELRRYGLDERYVNDERGLEQGFTVYSRPDDDGKLGKPLVIEMGLDGELGAYPTADGREVVFHSAEGPVLRYGSLVVRDATGRGVPAHLAVGTGSLTIVITDEDAVYPIEVDPLMTSPVWTVEGAQANGYLGVAVATSGDVNGDGFSDVVVGAHGFDNGQLDEGQAFVYLGSASGPSTVPSWTADGDQGSAAFGRWVATAGDVNGDGYGDVLIGASNYDGAQGDSGRVFLWYGSAAGLGPNGTPVNADWSFDSGVSGAMTAYPWGSPMGTAGDINADGYDDVIIGAVNYTNSQTAEGVAWVFLGSPTGLAGTSVTPANADWTAESNQVGARFGATVGTAGDVNGDGYADVVVGAPLANKAFAWFGGPTGLGPNGTPGNADWTVSSAQSVIFGASVATAGDVDGDGYSEVIVGASLYDGPSTDDGAAYVYKGSATGLATSPMWTHVGAGGEHFGICVATAGDVNGDGFSDIIVGADLYSAFPISGAAYLWYGGPTGLGVAPGWSAVGGNPNTADSQFGFAVGSAGDVNGDGFGDVIVGAYGTDTDSAHDIGEAYVFLGSAAGLATAVASSVESDVGDAQLGWSVASAGDVNGDGYSDVVVGAYRYNDGEFNEGRAFLYLGSPSGLALTPSWTADGNQVFANFGYSVSTAGDVNGDGYADVLVGALNYDNGQADEGWVYVYLGSADGLAEAAAWSAESDQAGAQFGLSVAAAGDVNGDGFGDVIIGAPTSSVGNAYAWYGSASGLGPHGTPANADWTAASGSGDQFGASVACLGDVNRDGFSDVAVGAPFYTNGQSAEGGIFVYHGSASGLGLSPAVIEQINQGNRHLGSSVAGAGDVNGDGYSDLIAGMPDFSGVDGRAVAWYGSASGLAGGFDWSVSQIGTTKFGGSVASAGDVNGDGYGDVIVGARLSDNVETDEGSASIFFGSASGLATSAAWKVEGNQNNALLGISVAAAGDVNGDGFSDVLVGASGYSNGQSGEGTAFVYYGNGGLGGFDRAPLQVRADDTAPIGPLGITDSESAFRLRALGRTALGRGKVKLEWEVKPLGTAFNGSGLARSASPADTGFPDLDVGTAAALDEQVTGLAPATVYHWRARVLSSSPFFPRTPWVSPSFNGKSEADLRTGAAAAPFVTAVFPPDDSEGQSQGTSVVLTFSEPLDEATLLYPGSVSLLDSLGSAVAGSLTLSPSRREVTINPVATLASLSRFTVSITAGARDLSGAGATPFTSHFTTGTVPGSTGTPLPTVSNETTPPLPSPANARTGSSVAGAGDLNGDGIGDFVAGAPGYQVGANVQAGAAVVYLGNGYLDPAQRRSPDIIFTGAAATDRAGVSVAGNFDFNGDGFPDLLIGAEQVNHTAGTVGGCTPEDPCNNGRAYLIYFDPTDATHYPNLGVGPITLSLSLVGQPGGIPGVVFTGAALGDQAGFSVSGVNGQHPADPCVIGVPGADPAGRPNAGTAYVIFPTTPPLSGTIALDRVANGLGNQVAGIVYRGAAPGDRLGFAVAAVGDVTGASADDFAFGAPFADPIRAGMPFDAGIVYVAGGGSLVPAIVEASTIGVTVNGTQILGEQAGARLGYSVAGSGVRRSTPPSPIFPPSPIRAHVDLLMGAPLYHVTLAASLAPSDGGSQAGTVIQSTDKLPGGIIDVCSIGGEGPESPIPGLVWAGHAPNDELGTSVAVLGDVDGDGTDDYALGAPFTDPNGVTDAGTIYLVQGAAVPSGILGRIDAGTIGSTTPGRQLVGTQAGENAGTAVAGTGDLNLGGFPDLVAGAPGKDIGADTDAGTVYEVLLDDGDGDGTVGSADCAPGNALVWSIPAEVRGGTLAHNRVSGISTITWLSPLVLGGKPSTMSYDTIRSTSRSDFTASAICLETGGADTASTDAQSPATGQVFYYVVRARNACGPGASGKASNGVERATRSCP